MTTISIIQVVLCVSIALLICIKKRTNRWQFLLPLTVFVFPPAMHALAQWRRIPMPSLPNWLVRIVVGASATVACIVCGNLDLLDTQTTREFKAQAMMLFSEHTISVEGISINVPGHHTIEIPSFGRTAFAIAAFALLYGIVFFRWPYEMMFVLAASGLVAGIVLDFWVTGATIDTIVETGNLDEFAQSYAYFAGAASIFVAIHWLTFALAAWPARCKSPVAEDTGHPVIEKCGELDLRQRH